MCLGYSATISICYLINHLENLTLNTKSLNHLFWKTLQIIRNSIIDQILRSHLKCNKKTHIHKKVHWSPFHATSYNQSIHLKIDSVFSVFFFLELSHTKYLRINLFTATEITTHLLLMQHRLWYRHGNRDDDRVRHKTKSPFSKDVNWYLDYRPRVSLLILTTNEQYRDQRKNKATTTDWLPLLVAPNDTLNFAKIHWLIPRLLVSERNSLTHWLTHSLTHLPQLYSLD